VSARQELHFISTLIREMSKMPCQKYLSGSEKGEKRGIEASSWKLQKIRF
jgi:hypothetical protein